MDAKAQNSKAAEFRSAHSPSSPLILCNVYDAPTASAIASLYPHKAKAMATASYAIASVQGVFDDDMSFEQNLHLVRPIAKIAVEKGIPLTVDIQDGYEDVQSTITEIIKLGAVGCNIEDQDNRRPGGGMRDVNDAVSRIKTAVETAKSLGVENFAVNARTDIMCFGGNLDDAIERGKKYLEAGAYTVFILAVPRENGDVLLTVEDAKKIAAELDGMVNLQPNKGRGGELSPEVLKTVGVARVSVGPYLHMLAMKSFKEGAEALLG